MNTIDYLFRNELNLSTAIRFTLNDLNFLKHHKLSKIEINQYKNTAETLTEKEIIIRILDLLKLSYVISTPGQIKELETKLVNLGIIEIFHMDEKLYWRNMLKNKGENESGR